MIMGSDEEEEEEEEEEEGGGGAMAMGGGAASSSRCEWHPSTVASLLDSYALKCGHIKGYLKLKDWQDIVRHVNAHHPHPAAPKTIKQCRDKVENLKRRYKLEKRRSPAAIAWSFFPKLHHIMTSLNKTHHPIPSHSFDCEGFAAETIPIPQPPPPPPLDHLDCSIDDILNTVGYARVSTKLDFEDESSADKKPLPKRKKPSSDSSFSNRRSAAKAAVEAAQMAAEGNPVQALADALVGFSEVYARIEIAKMEMLTKLVLELAKIHSKRRKKSNAAAAAVSTAADPK